MVELCKKKYFPGSQSKKILAIPLPNFLIFLKELHPDLVPTPEQACSLRVFSDTAGTYVSVLKQYHLSMGLKTPQSSAGTSGYRPSY